MGVPELLKVVARSAAGALSRIPRGSDIFAVDYALIDCTNVIQTLGIEVLVQFLTNPNIRIRTGIVFVLDGQRRRIGTSREQRVVAAGHENDALVQQCMVTVANHYQAMMEEERSFKRARHEKNSSSGSGSGSGSQVTMPIFSVCGRDVAGEGDYKILHLHRSLVCEAAARGAPQPSFLFVSEDSDLLCGALCGPAGHNISIATKLHGTTFELCLLRVSHVLAYIGKSADVLLYISAAEKQQQKQSNVSSNDAPESNLIVKSIPVVETTAADDAGRRRKVDGPMIALGKKTRLDDDDDDDGDDESANPNQASTAAGGAMSPAAAALPSTGSGAHATKLLPDALEKASYLQQASTDLVFLFMTVLGNGAGAIALIKGATKVDIAQCWAAYCAHKYTRPQYEGSPVTVRGLLRMKATPSTGSDLASFELNASFLAQILTSLNYSDGQSRPPSEEDRQRSLRFLESVVISTARYIVAAQRNPSATTINGKWSLLDSTLDTELVEKEPPNFVALLSVLADKPTISFTFTFGPPGGGANSSSNSGGGAEKRAAAPHAGPPGFGKAMAMPQARHSIDGSLTRLVVDQPQPHHQRPSAAAKGGATRTSGGQTRPMALHELFAAPAGRGMPGQSLPASRSIDDNVARAVLLLLQHTTTTTSSGGSSLVPSKLSSPFQRLMQLWDATLAVAVPQLQQLLLGDHQGTTASANTAAGMGGSNTTGPGKGNSNNNTSGSAKTALRPAVAHAYSFELRRLAPIASNASDLQTNSTAISAALKAAGLALDYGTAVAAASGGKKRTVQGGKKATKEQPSAPKQVATQSGAVNVPSPAADTKNAKKGREAGQPRVKAAAADAAPSGLEKTTKKKKKFRRPGKKERQERMEAKKSPPVVTKKQ